MPSTSYSDENRSNNRASTNVVKQDGGKTDIWRAAEMGATSVVQELLKAGAKPNVLTKRKKTPLHYAVTGGNLECVQMLLKNGADKTLQDDSDKTPLDYVKMFNDETKYGTFVTFVILNSIISIVFPAKIRLEIYHSFQYL